MTIKLENHFYQVLVDLHGAELTSVYDKVHNMERLWQADPKVWARHAPVLFPIVGKLQDDQYRYQNESYQLSQHGFARDLEFKVIDQQATSVSLQLTDNKDTQAHYPFEFQLTLTYRLINSLIQVEYRVVNPSDHDPLLFSIGGHPAFKLPMTTSTKFDDYFIRFKPDKTMIRWPLTPQGIDAEHRTLGSTNVALQLSHDLFKEDALIYETNGLTEFRVMSDKTDRFVEVQTDAPYVGLWSKWPVLGDFVCVEPWWGLADFITANGNLTDKFAIQTLKPQTEFMSKYRLIFG